MTVLWVFTVYIACERNLKTSFVRMLKRVSPRDFYICLFFAFIGVLVSYFYSFTEDRFDLFVDAYPSVLSLIISCVYLFTTALLEEAAWRGFLLERVSAGEKHIKAVILAGVIWALWHIPMWSIRNSLNLAEMCHLFILTVLISIVLGAVYTRAEI